MWFLQIFSLAVLNFLSLTLNYRLKQLFATFITLIHFILNNIYIVVSVK